MIGDEQSQPPVGLFLCSLRSRSFYVAPDALVRGVVGTKSDRSHKLVALPGRTRACPTPRDMTPSFTTTRSARVGAVCALILTCAAVPAAAARRQDSSEASTKKPGAASTESTASRKKPTTHRRRSSATSASTARASAKRSSRRKKSARLRGQQKIDAERATAIQEALIREHYLTGTPSGTWNQASEDAMRRYQGDHGWQTKEVPDSRALIKLGLGPSKDHLLNPESAMTTAPDSPRSSTTDHAAAAATSTSAPSASAAPPSAPSSAPTQTDTPKPQ